MSSFGQSFHRFRRGYILQGLAFGDEGKGSLVDYLCRAHGAPLVVRYNGGPHSTHSVVQPDGTGHVFRQFGSGMFISDVSTFISKHVLIEPFSLMKEAEALERKGLRYTQERLFIDPQCLIITPYHQYTNRIRELVRDVGRRGAGQFGAGETRRDALQWGAYLQVNDILSDVPALRMLDEIRLHKLKQLREYWGVNREADALLTQLSSEDPRRIAEYYRLFAQGIQPRSWAEMVETYRDVNMVFEGAAGALLDETRGFAPYVAPFNATFDNALELCEEAGLSSVRIGVLRTHFTRRGAGPFVSEDPALSFSDHSLPGEGQANMRFGHFDFVAARYAIQCCGGVDGLALTHMDCVESPFTYVDEYRNSQGVIAAWLKPDARSLFETEPASLKRHVVEDSASLLRFIEQRLHCKIVYTSLGPTYLDKAIQRPEIAPAVAVHPVAGEVPPIVPREIAG